MTSNFKTVPCLGYKLFADDLDSIPLARKVLVNTINQYSYCIAEKDSVFKNALRNSDILLPDGVGMTWASKFLNGKKIKKVAGADIHEFLIEKMNEESGSCFYLVASETTLIKIHNKLKREYLNIKIGSSSSPFKPTFTAADFAFMIQKVNESNPNVLFVGMMAPKQEK